MRKDLSIPVNYEKQGFIRPGCARMGDAHGPNTTVEIPHVIKQTCLTYALWSHVETVGTPKLVGLALVAAASGSIAPTSLRSKLSSCGLPGHIDYINTRILHSGSTCQNKRDSRNHGLWDSYTHVALRAPRPHMRVRSRCVMTHQ